jgi:choline dehydrogenase-like flavoprotein
LSAGNYPSSSVELRLIKWLEEALPAPSSQLASLKTQKILSSSLKLGSITHFSRIQLWLVDGEQKSIPPVDNISSQSARSQNFDTDADWNIVTEPGSGVNGRQVKVSRGKFLGGSSGVNGTLCIRGTKQDFDDWNMPGWSGEEVFGYMKKVKSEFHID